MYQPVLLTYSHSFFLIPLPPISTFFPYTTLFRSHRNREYSIGIQIWREKRRLESNRYRSRHRQSPARAGDTIDRKSTRLNSSHVAISYAVFCLKKKNKLNQDNKQISNLMHILQ